MKNIYYFLFLFIILFSSCSSGQRIAIQNNNLSKTESETLRNNGFYLTKSNYNNIFSLYKSLSKNNKPLLYTIDLPFYSLHLLFDQTLKEIELNSLYDSLTVLTNKLYQLNYTKYINCKSYSLKQSYLLASLYFGLPLSYLNKDFVAPTEISRIINAEQMLIEGHKGVSLSPIFSYNEDYSQYLPRGHYTSNDSLKRYFKAFMWFGRMGFYFAPEHSFIVATNYDSARIKMVKTSILIYNEITNDSRLENIWKFINDVTNFYIGNSDDISINTYKHFPIPKNIDNNSIINFIDYIVRNAPLPKIVSTEKSDKEISNKVVLCFKLMGQKYIPDSYIFQNLVYNKVKTYIGPNNISPFTIGPGKIRAFPMGLDIASVLGSSVANDILETTQNSSYIGYDKNLSKLKAEFSIIKPTNAYTYFLRFMQLTLRRKHYKHDPIYMKSKFWAKKLLTSVLSFWSMLRHDTILYAKQSYTAKLTSRRPQTQGKQHIAYLSPYGIVYKEMYTFCDTLAGILKQDKNLHRNWEYQLSNCKSLLLFYIKVTNIEMQGKPLDDKDMVKLYNSWKTWERLTKPQNSDLSNDSDMSIVADVHTDLNTKMVLEEAVGSPFKISAIAEINRKKTIFYGGVNSYYEFKYPMNNRLTDEKWKEIKSSMPLSFWEEELLIEE